MWANSFVETTPFLTGVHKLLQAHFTKLFHSEHLYPASRQVLTTNNPYWFTQVLHKDYVTKWVNESLKYMQEASV